MILDQLISDSELASLPDDEAERFAAMIRLTRPRFDEVIDRASGRGASVVGDLQRAYAREMLECAATLGLEEIAAWPLNSANAVEFIRSLSVFASRQRIANDMRARSTRVKISDSVKAEILKRTAEIREHIDTSGLTERRRRALFAKLDAFEAELAKSESNAAMLIGAVILVTATLSDVGGAAKTLQDSTMWIVRQVSEAHVSESRAVGELPNYAEAVQIEDQSGT